MTDSQETYNAVLGFLEEIRPGLLSPDDPAVGKARIDTLIDSFDMYNLIVFLEGRFNVHISDSEAVPENLGTLEAIVPFIQSKINHP